MNLQFFIWLEVQSLCHSAPVARQRGGVEKKTPIDPIADGGVAMKEVLLSESEVLTPLINSCKPDAKKKSGAEAPHGL